ncbi:MAG: DUF885 domain-containing protein [Gemmatimonadales bacterium]
MAVGGFREIERSYFDLRWHFDPVAATLAGLTAYDDRFGRYSAPVLTPHLAALKALAASLEEGSADDLEAEIDRTALLNEIRVTIWQFEHDRPQAKNPEFWLTHLFSGLHGLLRRSDRGTATNAAAVAGRLEDVPGLLDDARAALIEPVRLFAETALQLCPGGVVLVREIRAAYADGPEAERVAAAAEVAGAALAAFEHDLDRWTESGSEHFALGEDGFNFLLHYQHALRDTAPELWRYGLRLTDEVIADLARMAQRLAGSTDWPALVDRLRGDHPSAQGLVAAYAQEMERARAFVASRGLTAMPAVPLDVIETPEFMRPLIPFAAYDSPGPYAADPRGLFYVTVPDPRLPAATRERVLRDHSRHEIAATSLHEGYPGHHLHLVLAQANPSETRKNVYTPLTLEGWALYCEELMADEGFYASEEERFFQRVHLLWRAVRIVLDVGLHTRGMTVAEAVARLVDVVHMDRANAESEVSRYCATPGYQICYGVGRRELLQLRDDCRAARGDAFTLRGFHDAVLSYGGLPVSLIRWGMGLGG